MGVGNELLSLPSIEITDSQPQSLETTGASGFSVLYGTYFLIRRLTLGHAGGII